jgi:toxin YoeB
MYRLKKLDIPEPTLQASARATLRNFQASTRPAELTFGGSTRVAELTFQASDRTYLKKSEEVMTKYPGDEPEQNLRQSVFTDQFQKELKYWQKKDPEKFKRIRQLIEDIQHHPFEGIGKPKHLKYMGAGVWSRRINDEHRIVYLVSADQIDFLQARFHYKNK